MERFILILFSLLLCISLSGQTVEECVTCKKVINTTDYPNVKVVSEYKMPSETSTVFTSGLFTENPRVEDGYYKVNIFVYHEIDWKTLYTVGMEMMSGMGGYVGYNNAFGGITIAVENLSTDFSERFDFSDCEFILEPEIAANNVAWGDNPLLATGSMFTPYQCPVVKSPNETRARTRMSFAWTSNLPTSAAVGNCPNYISVPINKFVKIGHLALKIKNTNLSSNIKLKAQACSAVPLATPADGVIGAGYTVVGALDGKDIDIPLSDGPAKITPANPELNVLADNQLCLNSGTEGRYTYSIKGLPTDAEHCKWFVSAKANPKVAVGTSLATLAAASNELSATVTWKSAATAANAGQYMINVYAVSSDGTSSDTISADFNVYPKPVLALTANPVAPIVGDRLVVTANATGSSGYVYNWIKPAVASGNTYTEKSVAEKTYSFEAYVSDVHACKDTAGLDVTVGSLPTLQIVADKENQLCQNGASMLKVISIKNDGGEAVDPANCTFEWSLEGVDDLADNKSAAFNATIAGTYKVKVTNTKSTPNAIGEFTLVLGQVATPAPELDGNTYVLAGVSDHTVIEAPVKNEGAGSLAWQWAPTAYLDDATLQKPTTQTLPSNTNVFMAYVTDANGCRSKNATVSVNVDPATGIQLQVLPVSIELCKGNTETFVALVNGREDANYNYTWVGKNLTVNGSRATFTAAEAIDEAFYVTATNKNITNTKATAKFTVKVNDRQAPTLNVDEMLACKGSGIKVSSNDAGATYSWFVNGSSVTPPTNNVYNFAATGTYQVAIVAKSTDGCHSDTTALKNITVNDYPALQDLALKSGNTITGNASAICGDRDVIQLTLNGAADSIKWYTKAGDVLTLISGEQKDLKEFTVTSDAVYVAKAWKGQCATATAGLSLQQVPMPTISQLAIADSCGQAVIKSKGINTSAYVWSPEIVKADVSDPGKAVISAEGNYNVTLRVKNGEICHKDTSFSVKVFEKPVIAWVDGDANKHCAEEIIQVTKSSSKAVTYRWFKGNTELLNHNTTTYSLAANSPVGSEKIRVIATSADGCKDTVENNFTVYPKPVLEFVEGYELPDSTVIDGQKIDVRVLAKNGTGVYTYNFESPYNPAISNNSGMLPADQQYVVDFKVKAPHFFITVSDAQSCKDTISQTIAVKGKPLEIEIQSLYGDAICNNGSVILIPTVTGGIGKLNFKWYRNNQAEVISTDSILVVQNIKGNDLLDAPGYTVKVECPTTTGVGEKQKNLTYDQINHPTAPQIVADPSVITIKQITKTVLAADLSEEDKLLGTLPFTWHWSPENLISEGESHIQYPETKELMFDQKFQVYIVDENNCVSNVAQVQVNLDGRNGIVADVIPEHPELCKNNSVELKVVDAKGAVFVADSYKWISEGNLSSTSTAVTNFVTDAATTAKDYVQVVQVTKGGYTALAKNTVTVKSDQAPKLEFDEEGRFCSGNAVTVVNTGWGVNNEYTWHITDVTAGTTEMKANQGDEMTFTERHQYNLKVVGKGYGNTCWSDTVSATVFPTPAIQTITPDQEIASNGIVNLSATVLPATGVVGNWTSQPAGLVRNLGAEPHLTAQSSALTAATDFIYTVSNSEETKCSDQGTVKISIKASEFKITTSPKVLSICGGQDFVFNVSPAGTDGYKVSYTFKSDAPEFSDITSEFITGNYNFRSADHSVKLNTSRTKPYEIWIEALTESGSIARDTVSLTVNPAPTIAIANSGSTFSLCNNQEIPLNLTLTGGSSWKVEYSLGGVKKSADFAESMPQLKVAAAGAFLVTKVTNDHGCSITENLPGLTIEDVTPDLAFKSKVGVDSICLPNSSKDIELVVTKGLKYGLTVYYRKDEVQKTKYIASAADALKIAADGVGTYILDSITNAENCTARAAGTVSMKMEQFKGGAPDINFAQNSIDFCEGTEGTAELNITGGTPTYTLKGIWNTESSETTYTVASGKNTIQINRDGRFTLTSVTDKNGCVDGDVSGAVLVANQLAKPNLNMKNPVSNYSLCDGAGQAAIDLVATGGSADWKVYYKLGEQVANETMTASNHTLVITEGGLLKVDSIVNGEGCRNSAVSGFLQTGVDVKDDRPTASFANDLAETICGGTDTGSPINLTVTTDNRWPVQIWYHFDTETSVSATVTKDDQSLKLTQTGGYVLDSIKDSRNCKGTVNTTLKEIENGSVDIIAALVSTDGVLCKGEAQLDMSLKFTGSALANNASRKFTIKYNYTALGGSPVEKTLADVLMSDMYAQTVKIPDIALGNYQLISIEENGGCTGTVSDVTAESTVTVGSLPVVESDSLDFAAHNDDLFVLGVKTPDASKYSYAWKIDAGEFADVSAPFTQNGVMGKTDMQYILKGTDKTLTACWSTDTVNVYRIPDAPILTIDTNKTRNDLKLHWEMPEGSQSPDGFTIMSNRWDAYAMESSYSVESTFPQSSVSLAVPKESIEKDTLKFFYIQAYRNIETGNGKKKYYSWSSDTVGFKMDVVENVNNQSTKNNMIAWMFDMSNKGLATSANLFDFLESDVKAVRKWNVKTQAMQSTTMNPAYGKVPGATKYLSVFDLKVGEVYQLAAINKKVLLQYGKLTNRLVYTLERSDGMSTNNNIVGLAFHKILLKTTGDLYSEVSKDVLMAVRVWNFSVQAWKATTPNPAFGKVPGALEFNPLYNVQVGMPIQLPLKTSLNQFIWK